MKTFELCNQINVNNKLESSELQNIINVWKQEIKTIDIDEREECIEGFYNITCNMFNRLFSNFNNKKVCINFNDDGMAVNSMFKQPKTQTGILKECSTGWGLFKNNKVKTGDKLPVNNIYTFIENIKSIELV